MDVDQNRSQSVNWSFSDKIQNRVLRCDFPWRSDDAGQQREQGVQIGKMMNL